MTCQVREVAKSIEGERPSVPLEPYNVRITSGGRLKGWVDFSLKFFAENPGKPLVFHTLPRETVHLEDVDMSVEKDVTDKTSKALPVGTDGDSDTESITPRRSKSAVTSNVPRLVSVVEIIKREYLKSLPPGPRQSLHQYNQLQFLENTTDSADGSEDTRMREILAALEGKNHLKVHRTAYLRITLCTEPLPMMDGLSTYQIPAVRKISKSAKARFKKRLEKSRDMLTE